MDIRLSAHEAGQYSPLALAFVGDTVYEQLVRDSILLGHNMPARELHRLAVARVCAEYQSACAVKMLETGALSEEEEAVFRRGRNTKMTAPRHSTVNEYRNATGLECLFGYLHLTGRQERIEELFRLCCENESNE